MTAQRFGGITGCNCPGVDLTSFDEPYFQAVLALYGQRGREVWVLDLRSDLSIPVFAAVSRVIDGLGEELSFGLGVHLEARIGI